MSQPIGTLPSKRIANWFIAPLQFLMDHAEFRCGVLKEFFAGKRLDEIMMMSVVGNINERMRSDTVRKEILEDGTKLSRKRSPTTVNKEVTLLSSIFIMAIRERVTHRNPCDELPKSVRSKIPARRKRNRVLSTDEERRLFGEGLTGRREHLREPVEVALHTGMRRGEVLGLKPEHVNLGPTPVSFVVKGETWVIRPGWLIIEKSKNGKPLTMPMSGRARRTIERLCAEATPGGYVFESIRTGRKITDVKRGFTSACLEAGIENLTFHHLRHT